MKIEDSFHNPSRSNSDLIMYLSLQALPDFLDEASAEEMIRLP
jgi:hypothetical protein